MVEGRVIDSSLKKRMLKRSEFYRSSSRSSRGMTHCRYNGEAREPACGCGHAGSV
jgi:hypothetical protein